MFKISSTNDPGCVEIATPSAHLPSDDPQGPPEPRKPPPPQPADEPPPPPEGDPPSDAPPERAG